MNLKLQFDLIIDTMDTLEIFLFTVLSFYVLFVFYLAGMNIKRVWINQQLTKTLFVVCFPVAAVGYLIDFAVNVTFMTVFFLEIPREFTVSERLHRHLHLEEKSWRTAVAAYIEPILDPFDPTGNHI